MDEYWSLTDPTKYNGNIKKSVNQLKQSNNYTLLVAAITLAELGNKKGIETHKELGFKTLNEAITGARVLKTKMALSRLKRESKKVKSKYDIWEDVANLEQILGRSIDLDKVSVSYWIALNKMGNKLVKGKNRK